MAKPVLLIVLDGWGLGEASNSNPTREARLPTFAWLNANMPVTSLEASGISVGLPWGETGNSEVGHLTMGAGKVIYQHYPRITLAIENKSFFSNDALKQVFAHAREHHGRVHFLGLLSGGNTHASMEHLDALLTMAKQEKCDDAVFLHLFGDGKDSKPFAMKDLLKRVPRDHIATLVGRHYAMDREENWPLTKTAYELIMGEAGQTIAPADLDAAIDAHFKDGLSEEFLPPLRLREDATPREGDALFFFNFREDSIRQLAEAFLVPTFQRWPLVPLPNTLIATMTRYEDRFEAPVAFPPDGVSQPLGKVVADAGKTQLRVAETYKYAHVTYFFNGYRENPFTNEYRVLIPSLQTDPAQHPEMQASAITDRLVEAIEQRSFDFILANYANADTIGHTGNYAAGVKAAEVIDAQLARLLPAAQHGDVIMLITGDHGNIERMYDPLTGRPETQHDPNPVPFYVVGSEFTGRKFPNADRLRDEVAGSLADVAPTAIVLMGLDTPKEMTGKDLLRELA